MPYGERVGSAPDPVLPAYGGACIDGIVRGLLERQFGAPSWMPAQSLAKSSAKLSSLIRESCALAIRWSVAKMR